MPIPLPPLPLVVVALGGNALLRRGEAPTADHQAGAARQAAQQLAKVAGGVRLVVTHGNGPQVGLLALKEEAYDDGHPYPLDVLDAERETVAVITRVLVDADDPAFGEPAKFIGPVYAEAAARQLAADRGWAIKPDGDGWRRVVASPEPRAIVELKPIRTLVDAGYLVVCVGGGGIPVVTQGPRQVGVEAVVDKDLSSALLAAELGADLLVLATDVTCVSTGWGSPHEQAITQTTPGWLRARTFAAGSMAPKVDAVCRFVEETGKRAAIGRLADLTGLLEGTAGTQIASVPPWLSVSADDALADLAQPSSR